jgi:hypothetical protein
MSLYLTAFRTHVWDKHVAEIAEAARISSRSGSFIVMTDETRGPMDVSPFFNLGHTDDFASLDMPNVPTGRSLWWNADYLLYLLRRRYPCFDYYIMIEYDALLKCDLDAIIAECAAKKIDMVVHRLQQIWEGKHWAYPSSQEIAEDGKAWHALIPAIIVSGRALDEIYAYRRQLAERFRNRTLVNWPYCEVILPTTAVTLGLKVNELSRFINTDLLRFRPFISLKDPRLGNDKLCAHPVMGGTRFVKAFTEFSGHLMSDGYLCPELEREDPEDIAAVLGTNYKIWSARNVPVDVGWIDLSMGKPAMQSSISPWSKGKSLAIDASNATDGQLWDNYAFHTQHEENPWWAVDLGETQRVTAVEILNRQEPDRFKTFSIDTSIDNVNWTPRFEKRAKARVSSDPSRPAVFTFTEPVLARYVRITLQQKDCLHLRRVRVWGWQATDGTLISVEDQRVGL